MQLRLLFAVFVFAGSYLPLSVILLAQNYDYGALAQPICWMIWQSACHLPLKNPILAGMIFCVCALSFLITLVLLTLVTPKQEIVLTEAKYTPTDLMNYTLPYVVSFMSIDYQDTPKFVGLIVFLSWMFWITYKSGQIFLNPLLIVLGWRLYDLSYHFAADSNKTIHSSRALSKGVIESGETHRQIALGDVLAIKPAPSES